MKVYIARRPLGVTSHSTFFFVNRVTQWYSLAEPFG